MAKDVVIVAIFSVENLHAHFIYYVAECIFQLQMLLKFAELCGNVVFTSYYDSYVLHDMMISLWMHNS